MTEIRNGCIIVIVGGALMGLRGGSLRQEGPRPRNGKNKKVRYAHTVCSRTLCTELFHDRVSARLCVVT